jgi:hypothetical protein
VDEQTPEGETVLVNVDNFREAETTRMYDLFTALAGGVNEWFHFRTPTTVENQPVIRMNRDTLYSGAVVDTSAGATLTIPDAGDRYVSVMAIDTEHYLEHTFTEPGAHQLPVPARGDGHLFLAARIFVDPDDPDDIAAVNDLQDQLGIDAGAARPFHHPGFDEASLDETREALLVLSRGLSGMERTFGRSDQVDPVRHLIGTAAGWGGAETSEAAYLLHTEPRPVGRYTMTITEVPVDAFWSVTVYNRDGYLEPNPFGTHSVNSVTATPDADGSTVLYLAPEPDGRPNHVHVMDGWNYALRLYRPRPSLLDGTWTPPVPEPLT